MNIQEQFYKTANTQPSSYTALQVKYLNSDYWHKPHVVFSKFTYSDRCELFGKSLEQSPDTTKKVSRLQIKCPALMTDRNQTYVGCTK